MSTPNSPNVQPTETPTLAYPPSPPPIKVPPRLEDRLKDPLAPLTLEEQLGDMAPGEALVMHHDPTPPLRPQTPEGYIHYDPTDPNHA